MSQNPDCPYCAYNVRLDDARIDYDEKVKVRCPNCGGQFEYMPGFGSFSIPGEGPQTQRRVTSDGSYPRTIYEGDAPWTSEQMPQQQSNCGPCCAICCCCIGISIIFPLMMLLGGFFWLFG